MNRSSATANAEQYLETLYRVGQAGSPVAMAMLADEMGVSLVSANEMIKKLAARGFATYEPYRGAKLTEAGRGEALRVIRRHRLWERFLTDRLEIPWDRVHDEACRLEHATSELVADRLAAYLGEPDTCPHGHPMPSPSGEITAEAGCPMTDLVDGDDAVIVHVPERDTDLLRYLGAHGIAPDALVHVHAAEPFAGTITLRVGEAMTVLGTEVASRIAVRRARTRREDPAP